MKNNHETQGRIITIPLSKLPVYLKKKGLEPVEYVEEEELLIVKPVADTDSPKFIELERKLR